MASENFDGIINIVLSKYAQKTPRHDQEDLRQEAALALYLNRDVLGKQKNPNRLAYKIVRNKVIDILRKTPPRYEDISNPDVIKKFDRQSVHFPDTDTIIDSNIVVGILAKLSEPHRFILQASFGIGDTDKHSDKEIAAIFEQDVDWVYQKKVEGMRKLREMVGIKC